MDCATSLQRRWSLLLLLSVLPATGCSAVAAAMYVVNGNDVPAAFDELKEKRVIVVCRPNALLQYSTATVAKDLARGISKRLRGEVRAIEVVPQEEVDAWLDENDWQEFSEVGKALDADMVVGVELNQFGLYQGQTLYQGRAVYSIRVFDLAEGGNELVYEQDPPEAVYPPNVAIPTSSKREPEFRREFVAELSEQIGRHFYAHDSRADFAKEGELTF